MIRAAPAARLLWHRRTCRSRRHRTGRAHHRWHWLRACARMPAALRSAAHRATARRPELWQRWRSGKCGDAARRQSIKGRQTSGNALHLFETLDRPSQLRRALQNGAIPQAIKWARPICLSHNQQLFEPGALLERDLHRQSLPQPFVGTGTTRATARSSTVNPGNKTLLARSQAIERSNSTLGRSVPVQHSA